MRHFASSLLLIVLGNGPVAARAAPQANVAEQYLLAAANAERAAQHLPALHRNSHLAEAALAHVREMAAHRAIAHGFPGEPELALRAAAAGVAFSEVAENVAEGETAAAIHDAWMHSPGHRRNLLDPGVDAVGIAVLRSHGQLYAVEDFARTVAALTLREQEASTAVLLDRAGLTLRSDEQSVSDAREACSTESRSRSGTQPMFVMRWNASSLDHLPAALTDRLRSGRYFSAAVGACSAGGTSPFASYRLAVLLYP